MGPECALGRGGTHCPVGPECPREVRDILLCPHGFNSGGWPGFVFSKVM